MNRETMTPQQIQESNGKWYTYPELLGKKIAGRRAITTNPLHFEQYPQGIPVRTLVGASFYREKDSKGNWRKWYRLTWERTDDCGYSGYREDHPEPLRVLILPEVRFEPQPYLGVGPRYNVRKEELPADAHEIKNAVCTLCGEVDPEGECPAKRLPPDNLLRSDRP